MSEIDLKKLLEAGVHFGHQTRRWNPKMASYIYGERGGIYIIDLAKTLDCILKACEAVTQITSEGKHLLYVGTKKQAQESIEEAARRSEMPYVSLRWLGGMLTNFETVRKSVEKLEHYTRMEEEGTYSFYTKKEVLSMKKEREKLEKVLMGVKDMKSLPGIVFIVDPKREINALRECYKLGIPSIALIDTNSDPDLVTYPIPGNDDALRSIKLICETIADSSVEGRSKYKKTIVAKEKEKEKKKEEKEAKKAEEEAPKAEAGEEIEEEKVEVDETEKKDKPRPRPRIKKKASVKE